LGVKVIIVNGSGGVGKGLFVDIFKELSSKNVVKISAVDPIKNAYRALFGCEEKTEEVRKDLSDLLKWSEVRLETSYKYVDEYYNMLNTEFVNVENILFVDSREPRNIDYYKKKYNGSTILIANPRIPHITSNSSDMNVLEYHYDDYIINDKTIDEFKEKVVEYIKKYNY